MNWALFWGVLAVLCALVALGIPTWLAWRRRRAWRILRGLRGSERGYERGKAAFKLRMADDGTIEITAAEIER